ncbi:MAG: aldehyde dehydrogenase family protein [Cyclobacteriaceae bacterium]
MTPDGILDALAISKDPIAAMAGKNTFRNNEPTISSHSPIDHTLLGHVGTCLDKDYDTIMTKAQAAYEHWRSVPAPQRGEFVRKLGLKFRGKKAELAQLITWEMGKSLQESLGEVQELIDICDFATGLSRQLYGLTMHSERPNHRMYEQYHPIGIVGIITAFNFPMAVWSWNAMIAWVCGDVCIWKPSEKTPLCALACQNIVAELLEEEGLPEGISCLINGGVKTGELLCKDKRVPLISATGSVRMGRIVGEVVANRLGRSLLELGGNNAIIISKHSNLDLAIRATAFGAIGTCGQRCTSTRRLIVQKDVYNEVAKKLKHIYEQVSIGNPLDEKNHVGPLIDKEAVNQYLNALDVIKQNGGKALVEGGIYETDTLTSKGCYVKPAIYEVPGNLDIVKEETFAPILYIMRYDTLEEAIALQNDVPQGLSSAIFTENISESEFFLSQAGSDCGIANVNIGTSGAEIGGAFGGEKETGGGRESGSDAWKNYMRRQTNTINWGKNLPLAQGIKFDIQ